MCANVSTTNQGCFNKKPYQFGTAYSTFLETDKRMRVQSGETDTSFQTTSFLTATARAYANGAGITAAAGTRLALHLILCDMFN
jgi:hypothetical protein